MNDPELVVERRPGLLLLGLNRPEKRNALHVGFVDGIKSVLAEARRQAPAVLVLHSLVPKVFAAGADIAELRARRADDAMLAINAGLFDAVESFRWPSIAVVTGHALGGGCELALACDLRVGSVQARFAQPEPALGIIAAGGGNWRLPRTVGLPVARRILLAGATLDGRRAAEAGLLDELVEQPEDALPAALELADRVAARSWRALELTKLALHLQRPATPVFDIAAQSILFEDEEKDRRMDEFLDR